MSTESVDRLPESPVPPTNGTEKPPTWNLAQRIAFRFTFAYFALYFFPAPFTGLVPVVGEAIDKFLSDSIWLRVARFFGTYVLRLPGEIQHEVTGSGDTTYDYVMLFASLCLAAIISVIWSFVQRKKINHEKLDQWFRIWLRYTLATILLSYGAVKVVKLQFPTPNPVQLLKTYGESSPMNLLWTFMGFSTPYTFFAGLMEVIPAFLLLFRRTALLGAVLAMAVMGNVVMLNFCYDVPVKLFSSHLFLVALILALPDVKRLVQFFLANAPTEPAALRKPFEKKWMERGRLIAKSVFIAAMLGNQAYGVYKDAQSRGPLAVPSPYLGAYEVVSFVREGTDVPPLLTDASRVRYLILRGFEDKRFAAFVAMTGEKKFFHFDVKTDDKTLAFRNEPTGQEKPIEFAMQFTETPDGFESLEGKFEGANVRIQLRKLQSGNSLLMSRGFHWVNEFPFNR